MSMWLNNKKRIHTDKECIKPCNLCCFCPYGQLVEAFPISKKRTVYTCEIFGHDCPVFYMAEPLMEDKPAMKDKDVIRIINKLQKKFFNRPTYTDGPK